MINTTGFEPSFPMKKTLLLRLFQCLPVVFLGCADKKLSQAELIQYVADDPDLSKSKTHEGFDITVTFRPTDLLIAQELETGKLPGSARVEALREKYQDHHYFLLSLSKNKKEAIYQIPQAHFSSIVQTLSFGMSPYVNLTSSGQDTVAVADYIFTRTYGMGTATTLMFVFSREKIQEDEWIQFNLKEFGMGLGNHNFRFGRSHLESVPALDFTRL